MNTCNDSPKVVADPSRLPAPRPSLLRIAVPLIYAGAGVALGSLAGLSAALMTGPSAQQVASIGAPAADTASPAFDASATQSVAMAGAQTTTASGIASNDQTKTSGDERNTTAAQPAAVTSTVNGAVPSPTAEDKTKRNSGDGKKPVLPVSPSGKRMTQPVAHPVSKALRSELADAVEDSPILMDDEQPDLASVSATPAFYSEGDITVANYDPQGGTIETSDGQTFLVGTTVSVSNATSWDEYRSSVHYRCGQNGSCTLIRAGAVAYDAKLI